MNILGMGVDVPINLEPGLIEWPGWFKQYPFKPVDELRQCNYNVNVDYEPVVPLHKLNISEVRMVDEYTRSLLITESILNTHKHDGK
jgi:hypothetical protein